MKTYFGTKEILAKPMSRLDYNNYRGWELPSNENGLDEGYLVEYSGDNSNHPNHKGYISWSPKEQFENSYTEFQIHDSSLESELPHEQRVLNEAKELEDKISKLDMFINSSQIFFNLDIDEQKRLKLQLSVMKHYYLILSHRISNFKLQ